MQNFTYKKANILKKKVGLIGYLVAAGVAILAIALVSWQLFSQNQGLVFSQKTHFTKLTSKIEKSISNYDLADKQELLAELVTVKEQVSTGNFVPADRQIGDLILKTNKSIGKFKAVQKKAAEDKAKAEAEAKAAAEAKAKADADAAAAAAKKPTTTTYKPSSSSNSTAVATGSCSKNEYYVVVNVNTNYEQIYMGDPDCRTGSVVETHSVATGMHQNLWNPAGWWYWGATPTGKWRIMSKEPQAYSSQFGPWFLRLHYLSGGYVDSYALHGTDDPSSIGNWASHGCIRHDNSVIEHLAAILPVGTIVWTVS